MKENVSGKKNDWDARVYSRVARPHREWAAALLDRLDLRGEEHVLDAGCGSGQVTRMLLERVPRGRVTGVDLSPAMLAEARAALSDAIAAGRLILIEDDLTRVRLPEPVDAVFSNATFHWIRDHTALFTNLARNMRAGAWLVAQCGGAGNIARVERLADEAMASPPFAAYRAAVARPYRFATAEETARLLREAGFDAIETWLEPSPQRFADAAAFAEFLRTVVLRPYIDALPEALRVPFSEAVAALDAERGAMRTVDYVRLNIIARRA